MSIFGSFHIVPRKSNQFSEYTQRILTSTNTPSAIWNWLRCNFKLQYWFWQSVFLGLLWTIPGPLKTFNFAADAVKKWIFRDEMSAGMRVLLLLANRKLVRSGKVEIGVFQHFMEWGPGFAKCVLGGVGWGLWPNKNLYRFCCLDISVGCILIRHIPYMEPCNQTCRYDICHIGRSISIDILARRASFTSSPVQSSPAQPPPPPYSLYIVE